MISTRASIRSLKSAWRKHPDPALSSEQPQHSIPRNIDVFGHCARCLGPISRLNRPDDVTMRNCAIVALSREYV